MSYKPTIEEQETLIRIDRADDKAYIYTNDSTMITRINKLIENKDSDWELVEKSDVDMRVVAPRNMISFRTTSRKLSEEEKQRRAENLKKARERK